MPLTLPARPARRPTRGRPANQPRRPAERLPPQTPAVSLTRQARAHVLATREAAGLFLWCPRDLILSVRHKKSLIVDPPPGKEPHGHVCLPVA